jgi:predicted Zn-dependent protease
LNREMLSGALKGHEADYVEIRLEERRATGIRYRGKELEDVSEPTSSGGNVRALARVDVTVGVTAS